MSAEETLTVSKPAWASKGIIGSIVVILVSAFSAAKFFIPSLRDIEIDTDGLVSAITGALTLLFGALALWGRIKANSPVHFVNRKTVPGGEFNPNAEVRRAEAVHKKIPYDPRRKGGFGKGGYVRLPALVAGALWIGLFLLIVFVAGRVHANDTRRNPDITITPDLTSWRDETTPTWSGFHGASFLAPSWSQKAECGGVAYADWLKFSPPVDARPFFVRLLFSVRPWGEVGTDKGKVRVDKDGANASATYRDGERPSKTDLMPQSAAVGMQGGADY